MDAPTVDDRVSTLYHILRIYDGIIGSLVDTISVNTTSYHFVDNNLFIHSYAYVITGVNELGEGISNNKTFSYQRIPRSVNGDTVSIEYTFTRNTFTIIRFNIPVILECASEAPNSAAVTVHCSVIYWSCV
uniref:Uncharacterized protein n=1 Tax=Amphimedon queenslandica TaxID=400682 RepID=A0A1X7T9G9_AMPQE